MASTGVPLLFQTAVNPLSTTFSYVLFGVIGTFTSLIVTYHTLDVLQDQFSSFNDVEDTFDFVIVGAGSAGSVLANRLSEDYKVLVLEAGGEPNPLHSIPVLSLFLLNIPHVDWQYFTTPQKKSCLAMNNRQCAWPRGKALGGSSNLNFMIYIRGHPKDFDHWANVTGDPKWEYENVLPFFKKSEDYHGDWDVGRYHAHGGNLNVAQPSYVGMAEMFCEAGKEFGYPRTDLNAEFKEGCSPIYYTQKNGRRFGTYKAFIEPIRDRKNLYIYKFSHVTKIMNRSTGAFGILEDSSQS
ncbi:unnamed protein product [Allacma fusca]|uniref:Glucose-methanol-choline oxidoreductase N-terminal domain-containing protein n=1 Tax=Allacma fusca TaxID=39272 RepID=A0A8J2PRP2_9HEXA|nr:unnamed protein product [Allacma fusca]